MRANQKTQERATELLIDLLTSIFEWDRYLIFDVDLWGGFERDLSLKKPVSRH